MEALIITAVIVSTIVCAKGGKEILVPVLIGTVVFGCILMKQKEYLSTPDESNYLSKLQSLCLDIVDESVHDVPVKPYTSSFTEDKKRIYVCTKDKKGNFFSKNDLIYVLLHEYAHATTKAKEKPHGPEWKKNFDRYLELATKKGIYNPKNPLAMEYMTECAPS